MRTRHFFFRSFLRSIKCERKLWIILRIDKYSILSGFFGNGYSDCYLFLAKIATRYVVSRPFSTPQCLRFGELTAAWFTEEADRGAKQHRDSSGPLGFNLATHTNAAVPAYFPRSWAVRDTHCRSVKCFVCNQPTRVYAHTRDHSTTNRRTIVFSIALERSLEKGRDLWKNFLFFFSFSFFSYGTIRSYVIGDTVCLNVSDSRNDNEC